MTPETRTTFAELTALEERYQLATYKKMPIVAERGEGAWLYTSEGEKYLDLYVVTRSPAPVIRIRTWLKQFVAGREATFLFESGYSEAKHAPQRRLGFDCA